MMLEFKAHVITTPTGRPLQDPFDYRLPTGRRLGVTGPSGCGKSMLLRQIARASARGGTPSIHLSHGRLDYVPQADFLFPWYSIRRNYIALLNPSDGAVSDTHLQLALHLGLGAALDLSYGQLSGGERQRAALWTTLCGTPDFVAIDEPFTALDIGRKVVCMEALASGLTRMNATCIVVSHDFEILTYLCDAVLIFSPGRGSKPREIAVNDTLPTSRDEYLERRRRGVYEDLLTSLAVAAA